jgi:transcriptional regulator with XRE-family HTH domain
MVFLMEKSKYDIMYKTANRIRSYRTSAGLSQKSLATMAGLDPAFLGHIERCLKCPTIDTLNKISNALNITLSQLLDFDRPPEETKNEEALKKITVLFNQLTPEEANHLTDIIFKIVEFKKY